jgi:galactokinase
MPPTPATLEVQQLFKRHYGHAPPFVVQAPGRLELLGNHTDYNQGLVLALAVNRFIAMAVTPRKDGRIELVSSAFPEKEIFSVHEFVRNLAAPWSDYVKGVLNELRRRKVHFSGFSAAIHGTIPLGAGMSSSAALEVATALAVRQLHPYTLTATGATLPPKRGDDGALPPLMVSEKIEMAKACQAAESGFVGVNCGLLDQISSLFGKAFHAIEIDCQSLAVEHVPMIGEIAIVVCNSGVKHALVAGEYNELRVHCEAAARVMGAKTLRSVDLPYLTAHRRKLGQREYECAHHIVGEIQRVIFGARALRDGDFEQFGQYLLQSHESSRDVFRNSCAELDLLVELARAHPACFGARLTGGGFGGATINLVKRDQVEAFNRALASGYEQKTGRPLTPMVCQVVDGAK